MNKILHAPLSELRRRGTPTETLYIDAVRVLFRLGVDRERAGDREPDDEDE